MLSQQSGGVDLMVRRTPVDALVAESERLRKDLLQKTLRLSQFASELMEEAHDLIGDVRTEGDGDVRGTDSSEGRQASSPDRAGNEPDQ